MSEKRLEETIQMCGRAQHNRTQDVLAIHAALWLACALPGCGPREPFGYFPTHGTIAYEDGSLLPVEHLVLSFHPQLKPSDNRTSPRPASALVESRTGRFSAVTSHLPGDGLMACTYRVTLHQPSRLPLPRECVDEAYGDPARTPLEIKGGRTVVELRIAKPVK